MRLASLLIAALLVAGCGGGSTSGGDHPSSASLVLRPGDLPAGWTSSAHDTSTDNYGRIAARYNRCVGQGVDLPTGKAQASSPDFAQANGARQVKSSVTFAGDDVAGPAVRNLSGPRAADCLTDAFQTVLPGGQVEGLSVRSVDTEPLALSADVDEVAALRTKLGLRLRDTDFSVYVDNVFLADGPWFGRLYFVGTGTPLDDALEHDLVKTLAGRLADAD